MSSSELTFSNGQFRLGGKPVSLKEAVDCIPFTDGQAAKVLDRLLVKRYSVDATRFPDFLDPHQIDGVRWILSRSRSYLAHAPGAGKTAQAIVASFLSLAPGRTLFIVPPSLTANWEREIWKFAGLMSPYFKRMYYWPSVAIIPETAQKDFAGWNAEFLICPDSMLAKPWVIQRLSIRKWNVVAVDEASRFKESTAERTKTLFGGVLKSGVFSPGIIQNARHAVLMDGSPMPNRPMELWAPTFAMAPETIDFMSQQDFGFRYCGAKMNGYGQWEFDYSSHEDELRRKLTKNFMHVVTEEELDHPERQRSILTMNEDARSPAHRTWERMHTPVFTEVSEDSSQGELATFRRELGLRKVPWISDYVSNRLKEKNESILLFAWHREVCELLAFNLKKFHPGIVMGGTNPIQRETYFEEFQNGKIKLIIGNILAMGRGHNLQRADRVIFGEFSWTDELNKQCEKRASRRGSMKAFTRCEYVVSPGSFDEVILNSVFTKISRVKKVIG